MKVRFTVKTRIKEHAFFQFRLILFLYIGSFLQNQPEDLLKVSGNYILHTCRLPTGDHNVSLNELMILALIE